MKEKIKSGEWSDFSKRIVRIHGLPDEAEIRLYRKKDGRRIRSDFVVKRKAVNSGNVVQLKDTDRVSDFLAAVRDLLSTDVEARGLEMRLYDEDGNRVNGNTQLKRLRISELKPSQRPMDVFFDLLGEAGIDDIQVHQAGKLYCRLGEVVGLDYFEKQLMKAVQSSR